MTIPLKLGAWNVSTVLDRDNIDRPQRRTALIGNELVRCGVGIAAPIETRLSGAGELCVRGIGYPLV